VPLPATGMGGTVQCGSRRQCVFVPYFFPALCAWGSGWMRQAPGGPTGRERSGGNSMRYKLVVICCIVINQGFRGDRGEAKAGTTLLWWCVLRLRVCRAARLSAMEHYRSQTNWPGLASRSKKGEKKKNSFNSD
jgi:hypothetical protein